MSGTPKVSTEKDGIFGRGMYIWDGSVFRKLLGTTAGYILSGLRPATDYIPIQINTVISTLGTGVHAIAGVRNDTIYTVPANKILYIEAGMMFYNAGTITDMYLYVNTSTTTYIMRQLLPVLNTFYFSSKGFWVNEGFNVILNSTSTVAPATAAGQINGYLISKT